MKICIKMWMKTCVYEFYEGQLKNKCFTLLICNMPFIPFKWLSFFLDCIIFFQFWRSKCFSLIQQAPGPDFRKVGKYLLYMNKMWLRRRVVHKIFSMTSVNFTENIPLCIHVGWAPLQRPVSRHALTEAPLIVWPVSQRYLASWW